MRIDIRGDLKPLQRAFVAFGAKQVPFATSLALNALAKGVAAEERKAIDNTFDTPTPFTENAYRIEVATKSKPIAIVAAKDIQATYLAPYVLGGQRSLGTKRGMIAPRTIALNRYGNLPKGKLKALQAKPGVFYGTIRFRKSGKTVTGIWQRPLRGERRDGSRGTKGRTVDKIGGVRTGLTLLVQFEDTTQVRKRLPFFERAQAYVRANAAREFDNAMRRALATAR